MDTQDYIIACDDFTAKWIEVVVLDAGCKPIASIDYTSYAPYALKINGWFVAHTLAAILMCITGDSFSVYPYEIHCSDEEEDDECPF